MRVIVVGLGVQGRKRLAAAAAEAVATVDPFNREAQYASVQEVPLAAFDAALVCTPDEAKLELLTYLLSNGKHVLVEKPLFAASSAQLDQLKAVAVRHGAVCYTAYNHRFEPHFVRMKALLDSGRLGRIYSARLFYGNGTARLVRDSAWRDRDAGVLPDLGSHLLDTALFWFGRTDAAFRIHSANRFENRAFDHVAFGADGGIGRACACAFLFQAARRCCRWKSHCSRGGTTSMRTCSPRRAVRTSNRSASGGRAPSRFATGSCPVAAPTRRL